MHQLIKYISLALTILLSYLVFHGLELDTNIKLVQLVMVLISLTFIAFHFARQKKKGLSSPQLISLIILLGFVLRIGYTLYTGCTLRPHDIGDLTPEGYGHAAYILKLILYHKLPETNLIQLYHPPLFHLLGAAVSSMVNGILGITDYESLVDASKLVSCFASCGTLLLCESFCNEIKLTPSRKALVLLLTAFSPNLILMGGRVNNDSLVTFFMAAALLYTYRWYKIYSLKNTILLALIFGLGMMTKSSMGVIALFTAFIMCKVLINVYRKHHFPSLIGLLSKLVCFGLISLPIGLWFYIRNYILFEQPFGYVLRIPETERIFCGDEPFFQRFIKIDIANLIATPFAHPWDDFNYPVYIIKSSLFGEFELDISLWIPYILLLLNILLIAFSLWALCYLIYFMYTEKMFKLSTTTSIIAVWLLILVSNVYFNIKYPFGCTMDFRYMPLTVITGALFMALIYKEKPNSIISKSSIQLSLYNLYQQVLPWLVLLFCLFSFLLFVMIRA